MKPIQSATILTALALIGVGFGYVLTLQSWDFVDSFDYNWTYSLEVAFTLGLAGVGLWHLIVRAAERVGRGRAAVTVAAGAVLGMLLVGIVPV